MTLRRALVPVTFAALLAACSDNGSPTVEAGAPGESTTTEASTTTSTPTTSAGPSTTIATQTIDLVLSGDEEVPGPGSTGTAEATLTYDGDELCVSGTTTGVGALIAGHIHAGLRGESGPVVVDLGIETDGDGPFEGCAMVGAEGGVVVVDPSAYYVNLHTAEFPDGAVRAQLG